MSSSEDDFDESDAFPEDYRLKGYRIVVPQEEGIVGLRPDSLHSSGGELAGNIKEAICPNCGTPLFPVFKLNFAADARLQSLNLWEGDFLQLLRCFVCFLEHYVYWTYFKEDSVEIIGGCRSEPPHILPGVQLPYLCRPIQLTELTECDYPSSEKLLAALDQKRPLHQIGGLPFRGKYMFVSPNCAKCDQPMQFAGVIDDEDYNVYCYDSEGFYCTLIIGDLDSLYFYTCKACMGIAFKFIY